MNNYSVFSTLYTDTNNLSYFFDFFQNHDVIGMRNELKGEQVLHFTFKSAMCFRRTHLWQSR